MRYDIGAKIKTKSFDDILLTLNGTYSTTGLYFNKDAMKKYCGKNVTVTEIEYDLTDVLDGAYMMGGDTDDYVWVDDWVEPIPIQIEPVKLDEDLFIV